MVNTSALLVIGVVAAVLGAFSAIAAGLYRLVSRRRREGRPRHRPRGLPAPDRPGREISDQISPLHCHHEGCRFIGELFWQSRYGLVVLCRNHAHILRNRLEYLLETTEPGGENK